MLIFGRGLKIAFWDKKQLIEGKIRYKMPTQLAENAYVVTTPFKSDDCIVHEDNIVQVQMKDMDNNDVWVKIDDLYKSFPNGSKICPLTKYDTASILFDTKLPKVRLSPITSNSFNYAVLDEQAVGKLLFENEFKQFLKEVKKMNVLSFEVEHSSIWNDNMRCRLDFEIDLNEAYKYEPLMKRIRCGSQTREFGEFVLSAFLDGTNLPKPKKVIFHDPATIVFWEDGTKTVVKKTENDTDDREKAVMFAILKKVCGSRGNMNRYLKLFKEDKSNEEKKEEAGSSELCQCEQGAGEGSSESTV